MEAVLSHVSPADRVILLLQTGLYYSCRLGGISHAGWVKLLLQTEWYWFCRYYYLVYMTINR